MDNINVQIVDFPVTSSYEMVRANEDGSYTILLNGKQAQNQLEKAYADALKHIRRGDCDGHGDVQRIEKKVHGGTE